MGRNALLFVAALAVNLVWLLTAQGKTLIDLLLFDLGLLVSGVVLSMVALVGTLLAAQMAERAGRAGLARAFYRLATGLGLIPESRFASQVSEMALATQQEDYAAADALWLEVESHLGNPAVCATWAVANRAASLVYRGRLKEALQALDRPEAAEDSEKVRSRPLFPLAEAMRLNNRASALIAMGHFDEAESCLAAVGPGADRHPPLLALVRLNRAWLAWHRGDREGALRKMDVPEHGPAELAWALLLAVCGELDRAEDLLSRKGGRVCPEGTVRARYLREMAFGWVAAGRDHRTEALRHWGAAAALPVPPGYDMLAAARLAEEWGQTEAAGLCREALRTRAPESVWAASAA
ncbi:MAG: hypothetical protein HY319_07060 [Armatimonadetes bacterium]|nr:hypothetical protein [Armatimonadota bacterium]